MRGTTKSVDMGVSMLFVTDKKSEFTNGSMHHVSITMYCQLPILQLSITQFTLSEGRTRFKQNNHYYYQYSPTGTKELGCYIKR